MKLFSVLLNVIDAWIIINFPPYDDFWPLGPMRRHRIQFKSKRKRNEEKNSKDDDYEFMMSARKCFVASRSLIGLGVAVVVIVAHRRL